MSDAEKEYVVCSSCGHHVAAERAYTACPKCHVEYTGEESIVRERAKLSDRLFKLQQQMHALELSQEA